MWQKLAIWMHASAYEASDCTRTPKSVAYTSETCYVTQVVHYKNVLQTWGEVQKIKKQLIFVSDNLTIVWILCLILDVFYAFMYIYDNWRSMVFSHFVLCSRVKLRPRDAVFGIKFSFQVKISLFCHSVNIFIKLFHVKQKKLLRKIFSFVLLATKFINIEWLAYKTYEVNWYFLRFYALLEVNKFKWPSLTHACTTFGVPKSHNHSCKYLKRASVTCNYHTLIFVLYQSH